MDQDLFALALERALYDWYFGGENADPEPVFNAIQAGLSNEMQVLVPIETPESMINDLGDLSKVKPGDTFTANEEIRIRFRHLVIDEQGRYFIPLFTSNEEMEKGETSSCINQSLRALFDGLHLWPNCVGFIINPWDKKLALPEDMLRIILDYKPKSHISFIRGSVVEMHVGAIVNAANTSLLGGGGVDGAIHKAAGPELLSECKSLHGCRTGEAKITGAHKIHNADYIIHTVGPVYSGSKQDASQLANCYLHSLDLAHEHGCSSIAFPGISTGVYGYPLDEAVRVSINATVHWLDIHPDVVMNVYFCCFQDTEYKAYTELLAR